MYVLDEPKAIERKFKRAVTDSGEGMRRAPDKPGITNLIDILAAVRGVDPAAIEREFADARYGDFKAAVAAAVIGLPDAGPRALRGAARRTSHASRRCSPTAPSAPARSPRRRSPTCAARWASGAAALSAASAPGASVHAVHLAELELDLDVFSGPFDLLLTLVLREEVDLRELALAEVVLAYLDHLERRGELDLEATTEFIVLVAALLELKSRLLLPGRGARGAARARARRGRRGAARADARRTPLPLRRRAPCASCSPRSRQLRYPRGAAAGAPAPHLARGRRPGPLWQPEALGRALGGLLALPPKLDLRHISVDARLGRRARRAPARAAALRRRAELRRRRARRRPDDGRGDAVGAARAAQARRGELGAGRAVRRDHGAPARRAQPRGRRAGERARAHRRGAAVPRLATRSSAASSRRSTGADAGRPSPWRSRSSAAPTRPGERGLLLREAAGGWTLASDPIAEDAARALLAKPRLATLTPAQLETLAIVAYLAAGLAARRSRASAA